MALDHRGAALSLHRFGFGPRAGTIAAIAADPQGALIADLDRSKAGVIADAGLMPSGAANRMVFEFNAAPLAKQRRETRRQEALKEAAKRAVENPAMQAGDPAMAAMENGGKPGEAQPAAPPPPENPALENFF